MALKQRLTPIAKLHWENDPVKSGAFFIDNRVSRPTAGSGYLPLNYIWRNLIVEQDALNRVIDSNYKSFVVNTAMPSIELSQVPALEYIAELDLACLTQHVVFNDTTLVEGTGYGGDAYNQTGSGGDRAWEIAGGEDDNAKFREVSAPSGPRDENGKPYKQIKMMDGSGNINTTVASKFSSNPLDDEGFALTITLADTPLEHAGMSIFSFYFGQGGEWGIHFELGSVPWLSRLQEGRRRQLSSADSFDKMEPGRSYLFIVRVMTVIGANYKARPNMEIVSCGGKKALIITSPGDVSSAGLAPGSFVTWRHAPQEYQSKHWIYMPPGNKPNDQINIEQIPNETSCYYANVIGMQAQFGIHQVRNVVSSATLASPIITTQGDTTSHGLDCVYSLPGIAPNFKLSHDDVSTIYAYGPIVESMPPANIDSITKYAWAVTFNGSSDNVYTPYLRAVSPRPDIDRIETQNKSTLELTEDDLISLSITQTTESSSMNLTLLNDKEDDNEEEDKYGSGKYRKLSGIHYLAIDAGWQASDPDEQLVENPDGTFYIDPTLGIDDYKNRVFSGRTTDPRFNLSNVANSTISLTGQDNSLVLSETPTVNLPIYDGWCAIQAILDLAMRAGFPQEQILSHQNPRIYEEKRTLSSWLTEDCIAHRCDHVLPSGGWFEQPLYMFAEGTTILECIKQIASFLGAWVFCNNWGNLIIVWRGLPESWIFYNTVNLNGLMLLQNLRFNIQPSKNAYNEMQGLSVNVSTDHIRNNIVVLGLNWDPGNPVPLMASEYDLNSIVNQNSPNYIGMERVLLIQDPRLNTMAAVKSYAFRARMVWGRPRYTAGFNGWGQAEIFPYDILTLAEPSKRTPVGELAKWENKSPEHIKDGISHWRVTSVTHDFSFDQQTFTSSFDLEWVDPTYLYYPLW